MKIDIGDKKNHKSYKQIDLGYSTEKLLMEAVKKGGLSEKQVMEFRIDCRTFLISTLMKVLMKCPLTYSLVRNMSALDPREMANNPSVCREKMKKVLNVLVNAGKTKEQHCDDILQEYASFLDKIPVIGSNLFLSFNPKTQRVDEFFIKHMPAESFPKLLTVVKLLLVLLHGQVSVERGFSVNKETVADNLSQKTIVARRVICDHVRAVGGVLNISITKDLMQSASLSRKRYNQHLKQKKQEKTTKEQEQKRKHVQEKVDELNQQQKRMKLDIDALHKTADTYYEKAESTGDITHVTKGNALNRAAKEKSASLCDLEKKLEKKLQKLKQC